MAENHPRPDVSDVEALLQELKPVATGLDRDRVLFRAGRASVLRPGRFVWPATSGVLALATLALSVALAVRPEPGERIVYVTVPQPAPPKEAAPSDRPPGVIDAGTPTTDRALLTGGRSLMERQLLRWGLDALPMPAPANSSQQVYHIRGVTADPPPAGTSWLNLFSFEGKEP
jgi:hypothetical protein